MRLEDLHAKVLRHKRKEVETIVKLGILASSVEHSEHESSLGTLLLQSSSAVQPDFRGSNTLFQSHGNAEQNKSANRRRYVAVLDTNNTFHVINRIAPKGLEGVDPELRRFSTAGVDRRIQRGTLRDSTRGKNGDYNSGAAMIQSAFI